MACIPATQDPTKSSSIFLRILAFSFPNLDAMLANVGEVRRDVGYIFLKQCLLLLFLYTTIRLHSLVPLSFRIAVVQLFG